MSDIISIDYEKMRAIANSFEQESSVIQQINNNINQRLDTLRNGGWIADAATQFYQQMDGEVMVAVNKLRQALSQASQVSREIATTLENAEDEACNCLPHE